MVVDAIAERRTSADIVFEQLCDQILSLKLLPGTRISEAEVAIQFGVSRQPVREAFNRLAGKGFLLIQPQRATIVQRFSMDRIQSARFVRLAIEIELAKVAAGRFDDSNKAGFLKNLKAQTRAADTGDALRYRALDEEFHQMIASVAGQPETFSLVLEKKAEVDRICVLSLKEDEEMQTLVSDHHEIFKAIAGNDPERIEALLRLHLSRIEKTINSVRLAHGEYFES